MTAVFERKDGTHILCGIRPPRRPSRRRIMVSQFVIAVACLTLGLWLMCT